MTEHRARVCVPAEVLVEALHFPEGTEILGLAWDAYKNEAQLIVSHPDLPLVKPGGVPLTVAPRIGRDIIEIPRFEGWGV